MTYFFQCLKVFALFAEVEAGPRAVSEALKTGLPVVLPAWFRGGARDFLSPDSSLSFESYEVAHESLLQAVERHQEFRVPDSRVDQLIAEDRAVDHFRQAFARLFAVRDIPSDGILLTTDNLNTPLSGHYQAVLWSVDKDTTVNIQSKRQFDVSRRELLEGSQPANDQRKASW